MVIVSSLIVFGVVFWLLNMHMVGLFLLVAGIAYVLLCAITLFGQKHVLQCPSCGFEALGARKEYNRTGMSKCPKCGALIFTHPNK